ncbi:MAG TPA: hypothetical protein VEY08_14720, partial [Chloroflexia bacterium]|nr:hypothetical protein [Chloroflexia bacterium]
WRGCIIGAESDTPVPREVPPMRARFGAAASWAVWVTFIGLYALAAAPFLPVDTRYLPNSGLHYGSESTADIARLIVCLGPCLYLALPVIIFWQIINHWYEDSQNRRRAKTAVLLLSLLLLWFSMDITGRYLTWALD